MLVRYTNTIHNRSKQGSNRKLSYLKYHNFFLVCIKSACLRVAQRKIVIYPLPLFFTNFSFDKLRADCIGDLALSNNKSLKEKRFLIIKIKILSEVVRYKLKWISTFLIYSHGIVEWNPRSVVYTLWSIKYVCICIL